MISLLTAANEWSANQQGLVLRVDDAERMHMIATEFLSYSLTSSLIMIVTYYIAKVVNEITVCAFVAS